MHIKKTFFHTKRNELEVKEFMEQIKQIPVERLVYLVSYNGKLFKT